MKGRGIAAATKDADKKAQIARSKKFSIGIKDGGNVTKPAKYSDVSDDMFADPVNYRYPLSPAARASNAITRFNDSKNKAAGGYTDQEWGVIGKRIAKANAGKVYLDGQVVDEEKKKKESITLGDKDFSPGEFVNEVRSIFHKTYGKQRIDGTWPDCWIKGDESIFTDHVIAEMDSDLYSIPFGVKDGEILFETDATKWTKVEQTYTPVAEAVRILSAKKTSDDDDDENKGWEWDVVIIGAKSDADVIKVGKEAYVHSKNGVPYSVAALEDSVPLWDGIKVYDNHLTDDEFAARGTMRSVVNELVGVIVDPAWSKIKMAITGTLKVIDDKLRSKLLNAQREGVLDAFGLSIDALCHQGEAMIDGISTPVIDKIAKAFSVDVVADPAAGGRLARMIAGIRPLQRTLSNTKEVLDMEPEELKKLVKDSVSEVMSGVDERFSKIEARLDEGTNEPAGDPDPEPDPDPAPSATPDPVTVELQESIKKSREEIAKMREDMQLDSCRSMLGRKLEASGLPDSYRNMVAKQFRGKIFKEEDIDEAIKEHREALAKLSEAGDIVLPDDARISVSPVTEADRYEMAFLRLVAGNTKFNELINKEQAEHYGFDALKRYIEGGKQPLPRAVKLSEFYFEFTKDYEMEGVMRNKRFTESANVNSTTLTSIVKNTVNLIAAAAYSAKHLWWERIVTQEDVDTPDQATLVRTYGISDLSVVEEGAVYTQLAWSDDEETASFVKRGNYIGVTQETFWLDKLARLRTLPMLLANAWYGQVSSLVAAVFTTNSGAGPVLSDTGALFNNTAVATAGGHANYLTTALSHTAYAAARVAMMKQTDQPLGAGKKLLVQPKFLLVPVDLENMGNTIRNSEYVPGSGNRDRNQFYEKFEVITVPEFTDATDWALAADPAEFPAIYLIWLRGRRTPEIYSVEDERSGAMFTNDEMRFKVRQPGFRFSSTYDCAPVADYRPLHKSVVAG